MIIRKATSEDLEKMIEFNLNLAIETEGKTLDKEILSKGIRAALEDENKGVYHLCEIDGKVVGQIMYTTEWSDWRNAKFIWVQSVYVDKEFRGKGVFRKLYTYIKDTYADDKNVCGIRLYVEKENYIAQKTYENLGMNECDYYMYQSKK